MGKLENLNPKRVFKYFEEISAIPRGSENMDGISKYCMDFAAAHSLKAIRDDANNVIIFKDAAKGYENSEPVILQGHLDMVCQKEEGYSIDFEKDGLNLYVDGDFLKAEGTTLGADNGIAVAMILAILESDDISHPPIEALFTTDEEIGMIGAIKLDASQIKGKKMINLDAEEPEILTVSCAGGSDVRINIPIKPERASGTKVEFTIKGLRGGHSGVKIDSGAVNANMLAGRFLNFAKSVCDYKVISINGGDKANAIPNACTVGLVVSDAKAFTDKMNAYIDVVKKEIFEREKDFDAGIKVVSDGEFDVIDASAQSKLEFLLLCAPNGVMEMSAEIENLVETSLNLGVLQTYEDKIILHFALRSNKKSALDFLEKKLCAMCAYIDCPVEVFGHYPPWEFNDNSVMQKMYIDTYKQKFGNEPKVVALHAGLECGVLSTKIDGFDCIAIGPQMYDVHTVNERLSISSTKETFELVVELLKNLK